MRRALTTLTAATTLLALTAPAASADPDCLPVLRSYISVTSPKPGGAFGHDEQAFFARQGGSEFGEQVSQREARVPVCR